MEETLTITSGHDSYDLEVSEGTIRAGDLRQVSTPLGPLGSFDPGLVNTATCHSAITYIDGDNGILEYRGYPIEELAARATHLEVAYLLLKGELPTADELAEWDEQINKHRFVHENVRSIIQAYRYDAHPMAKLMSGVASMHTFYTSARNIDDPEARERNIIRLLGKIPTMAAWAYRHSIGRHYVYPNDELGYVDNFLAMLFQSQQRVYQADARVTRALEVLFILHADHEQNCSTSTVRLVGSAHANMFNSISAGIHALSGPLHGGANQAVLEMLGQLHQSGEDPKKFMERVKNKEAGVRLMGFGHRVYKNYDPRAALVKKSADEVLEKLGANDPLLDIAKQLEEVALADDYFVERRLYPNVDFYTGLIYKAMGFESKMFTVLFAIGRLPGWIAQWREMMTDSETKIGRPRQIYTGYTERDYRDITTR